MFLSDLFQPNPTKAVAFLLTIATAIWAILRVRRTHSRMDRVLVAVVGLLAAYQVLRLFKGAGATAFSGLEMAVNIGVAVLLAVSVLVIRQLHEDRRRAELVLRMAESSERRTLGREMTMRPAEVSNGLLDAAPMPMFAVGLDGCVSYWNHAAERLLGYRKDEVLGQKLPGLLRPMEFPQTEGRVQIVHKNGESLEGSVRTVAIRDSRGDVSGILTIVS